MPVLRNLRCSIRDVVTGSSFPERCITYQDNVVSTGLEIPALAATSNSTHNAAGHDTSSSAVPSPASHSSSSIPFGIRIRSVGRNHVSDTGLQVFVYIDGVYQCNRIVGGTTYENAGCGDDSDEEMERSDDDDELPDREGSDDSGGGYDDDVESDGSGTSLDDTGYISRTARGRRDRRSSGTDIRGMISDDDERYYYHQSRGRSSAAIKRSSSIGGNRHHQYDPHSRRHRSKTPKPTRNRSVGPVARSRSEPRTMCTGKIDFVMSQKEVNLGDSYFLANGWRWDPVRPGECSILQGEGVFR